MNHLGDSNKMVSDTPRMDSAAGHARGIVDAAIIAEGMNLKRELNAANQRIKRLEEELNELRADESRLLNSNGELERRIKRLKEALDLVVPDCSWVHHSKKHQHKCGEPCPVVALINKAKEAKP
jgi:predicted nuclease with TOPRIM domain